MKDIPVISCSFLDETSLYLAYMPFVIGGGLFIRTHSTHPLSSEVKLIIRLMNEPEPYEVDGKVVWVTPMSAVENKPAGIGVQFMAANYPFLLAKIESYLADKAMLSQPRDTF